MSLYATLYTLLSMTTVVSVSMCVNVTNYCMFVCQISQ